MPTPKKRYVATISLYIWAKDDEDAIRKSNKKAQYQRDRFDNQALVEALHEQPFATLTSREVKIK